MKIVIALIIFSLIILFHEFGHFLLAKMNKVTDGSQTSECAKGRDTLLVKAAAVWRFLYDAGRR